MGFFTSLGTKEGIISLVLVVIVCIILVMQVKKNGKSKPLSTKSVVAIGIGAALYGVVSMISLPIGPNTSFRIAIAILTIFGSLFGPLVGFLVGFIGHALNDALMWGSVWWSWVFLSAIIGLFARFINKDESFNIKTGNVNKKHIVKMYILAFVSIIVGSLVAYLGDVFLYGEPANKVWIQIIIASISNFAVIAILGIPSVIALGKRNSKNKDLETE